jgi:hypothetical protein
MSSHELNAEPKHYGIEGAAIAMHLHIANIDFPAFYTDAAGSLAAAREFYGSISHAGSESLRTAKIILHQAARMVWLADRIDPLARGRPALQLLFFMIAAEAVAKLAAGYKGERKSREHVRLFFSTYCTPAHRERIHRALEAATPPPKSAEEIADYLYTIRCDVVHRGRYFDMLLPDDTFRLEVRAVILEGVFRAAQEVAKRDGRPS